MAKARITFTFEGTSYQLQSDLPDPASRFRNWLPDRIPVGDAVHVQSNEQMYRFRTSWRYGAHFEIHGLGMNILATASALTIAHKLKAHLLDAGTCSVFTEDLAGSSYATCGLWPGSSPEIALADRRTLEYALRLSLINLASSPVEMNAFYHATTPLAYLMLSGGRYVFGTGSKASEATAFPKDVSGVYVLDSDPAEEDKLFFYVVLPDDSKVVV